VALLAAHKTGDSSKITVKHPGVGDFKIIVFHR
jgi:hypothetical protein